jgi:hypothetical protein
MTEHSPITPTPTFITVGQQFFSELVQQWTDKIYGGPGVAAASNDICLAKLAAQWGADQELEACISWLVRDWTDVETADKLRAARRPKPPSLKKQALKEMDKLDEQWEVLPIELDSLDAIRKALETLPDD